MTEQQWAQCVAYRRCPPRGMVRDFAFSRTHQLRHPHAWSLTYGCTRRQPRRTLQPQLQSGSRGLDRGSKSTRRPQNGLQGRRGTRPRGHERLTRGRRKKRSRCVSEVESYEKPEKWRQLENQNGSPLAAVESSESDRDISTKAQPLLVEDTSTLLLSPSHVPLRNP